MFRFVGWKGEWGGGVIRRCDECGCWAARVRRGRMGRCKGADGAKGQRDLAKRLGVLENYFHREELASEGKFARAADVAEIDGLGRIGGESFAASVIEAGDGIAEE